MLVSPLPKSPTVWGLGSRGLQAVVMRNDTRLTGLRLFSPSEKWRPGKRWRTVNC